MDLWLWTENEKLIVKSFFSKYEIKNGNIVMGLKNRFQKLSHKPIFVKKESMLCETENQILDYVCKKIYETVRKDISLRYNDVASNKITLEEQEVINLCLYENKRDMLEVLESNKSSKFRVVFPIKNGCVAMYGSKTEIQLVINKYAICNKKIDNILIDLGISKVKQLRPVSDIISFIIIKEESVFMKEKYIFHNIASCEYKKIDNIAHLELLDSNEINTELNLLSQLFEKMSEYIQSYGFDMYYQIPYKISSFKYQIDGNSYTTFAAGREPGEVYVRSLKLGIANLLSEHTEEQFVKWVVAQTRLDVMIEAVLPLLFDKLIEEHSPMLKIENVHINDCQDVVENLLQYLEKERTIPICIQYISIKNSRLKAGVLTILDDKQQQIWSYGIEKKQIISSLLVQYYALYIQNWQYLKEVKQNEIIRIGNDFDIYGKEEGILFENMMKEVETLLSEMKYYKLEISEWKYNQFLKETHMKCFKVKLKNRVGIV